MSTEKKKIGRPSQFHTINQEQLKQLALDGWTDKKIAVFFNITTTTLDNWKKKHPEFIASLRDWKITADLKVEKCLYKRAQGFRYKEVTTEYIEIGESKTPAKKTKVVTKQLPPDPTSMIFWLKNRQPDKWRDKKDVEVIELTPEEKRAKLARIKAIIGSDNE